MVIKDLNLFSNTTNSESISRSDPPCWSICSNWAWTHSCAYDASEFYRFVDHVQGILLCA